MEKNELQKKLYDAQLSLKVWSYESGRLQKEADIAARRKHDYEEEVAQLKKKIAEAKE